VLGLGRAGTDDCAIVLRSASGEHGRLGQQRILARLSPGI
jgi:hypothetical protein